MPLYINPELAKKAAQEQQQQQYQPQEQQQPAIDKWPMIATGLAGLGDIVSTQRNLANNGREFNPLVPQNRVGNAAVLGAGYLGNIALQYYLAKHGHPNIAKTLGYGMAAEGGYSAIANTYRYGKG